MKSTIWELDFYSRPLRDEEGKKVWEVLICETPVNIEDRAETLFRYTQFCPSNQVNSIWLKEAIETAIAQAPTSPSRIRFFRRPMANMIFKSCKELAIPAYGSRRTYALYQWLQERLETVYPTLENYQEGTNPSVQFVPSQPQSLPDALQGDKWAFVTLEASAFSDMSEWDISFGEAFGLSMVGLAPETLIPGFIIYSSRATPLAAWMSGLELAYLRLDSGSRPSLILETGESESWILANLPNAKTQEEAKNFELSKEKAKNVHFLAVQSNPNSESFAGFWLLQELKF
ncbi:Tab2/Atab2 family RNA-binding protein [Planktothrix sp. FACHB-1365]|uniref:Tab2/Atab2 family RNA-binding protein n=1 Tax=Planktothrix sp. FACHB-1365 TaxID=2692855 RepID=UPI00168955F8|nr:Tab2/Atab2 family RNA-binding protein [Planktothrix sp. FACHB-1365]MBD2482179.1 Tab2/Atab2 family RNA-binding protein [Planktothrix sp. FACHB-1365]